MPIFGSRTSPQRRGAGCGLRIIIAVIVAAVSIYMYYSRTEMNPVTGEEQRVADIKPQDDVKMGLAAAPELIRQFGGQSPDPRSQALADRVGGELLRSVNLSEAPYQFDFHVLADRETVNAFALPGGQVFITEALLGRLTTEGQLAGVLAHEIGHVLERHGAQQIAKAQLTQGLTGAAVIATYDPDNPSSRNSAAVAAMIGQLINMRYGREDELESDGWGVKLTAAAGYDPRSMVEVMKVLREAGGGRAGPEWASTHPDPENRIARIEAAIKEQFPDGVPAGLKK